jgi:hypothetical protein
LEGIGIRQTAHLSVSTAIHVPHDWQRFAARATVDESMIGEPRPPSAVPR